MRQTFLVTAIFFLLSFLAVIILFLKIPFNMDEFIHYHTIICHDYPLNMLNTMRESCSAYDLAVVPGYYWPLRVFSYSGSFLGALYYPLYKIWASPYSARFLGIVFLLLQSVILARFFRVGWWRGIFLAFLLSMPYAFQHVVDTGPVGIHITMLLLVFLLGRKWTAALVSAPGYSWGYAVLMGIVIFLGIWVKLFFFILLPALAVLLGYFIAESGCIKTRRFSFFRDLICGGGILCILLGMLLNALDRAGEPYYQVLFEHQRSGGFEWGEMFWAHLRQLLGYFTNPLNSAHRVFNDPRSVTPEGVSGIGLIVVFFSVGLYQMALEKKKTKFIRLNLGLFVATFLLMALDRDVWAMHHIVLSCIFLWLAGISLVVALGFRRWIILLGCILILINVSLYLQMAALPSFGHSHPSRVQINEKLNRGYSSEYIFVVVDWGMYYFKGLYGPKDQCVVFLDLDPEQPEQLETLKPLVEQTGRKLMFIGMDGSPSSRLLSGRFPELRFDFDTGPWRVWYQP